MFKVTTIEPTFPIALSSSLIGAYKQCPMKFYMEYCLNRVPRNESVHLVAGSSYAVAHEVFRKLFYSKTLDEESALRKAVVALTKEYGNLEPVNSYKTWDRTVQAFLSYYDFWKTDSDMMQPAQLGGKPSVEFSFAEPINIAHPTTGEPILYAGRFDALMEMGGIFVYDDKTTGSIGATWADQWNLRAQFTGYQWGAEKANIPISGIIIRGCAIQKTQIKFNQAITYRPKWQIERWYEDMVRTAQNIVDDWNSGYFSYNLNDACNMYGSCSYKSSCEMENPEPWFEEQYMTRTWEPIIVESL